MDLAIRIHNWELLGAVHTVDFNVENMQILVRHTLIFHTKIHMKCVCVYSAQKTRGTNVCHFCMFSTRISCRFFFSAHALVCFFSIKYLSWATLGVLLNKYFINQQNKLWVSEYGSFGFSFRVYIADYLKLLGLICVYNLKRWNYENLSKMSYFEQL